MFCALVAKPDFEISKGLRTPSYKDILADGRMLSIWHSFKPKPVDDSFVLTDNRGFTLLEGIVLNSEPLGLPAAFNDMLQTENHEALAFQHGQFACLQYKQSKQELRLYTNITNNFRVYYYHTPELFIAANSISQILELLKANNIGYSVDELGIKMMLSYGYMLQNWTTITQVRQLGSSNYISFSLSGFIHKPYFRLDTTVKHTHKPSIAKELKHLFTKAVEMGFKRDNQQKHFAFISGGLDSRLTVWTAKELGYNNVDCLNFSQPGYLDQTLAKQVCDALDYKMTFFSMEGGNYLLDLDDNLAYHEAQIVLHGAAHLFAAIKTQNLARYGIMHSGQLGDVIKGTYAQAKRNTPVNLMDRAYSTRLLPNYIADFEKIVPHNSAHELFVLENRGFNCITNGDLACLPFSYSVSPFLEPAFMQYCLNIDPVLRLGNKMYIYWMQKEYPQASKIKYERTNCSVSAPALIARLKYNLWRGSDVILHKLNGKPSSMNMNPFDYWWSTNPSLKQHFLPLFNIPERISSLLSPDLQKDINLMFTSGNLSEKLQAYTVVRGIDYFFH